VLLLNGVCVAAAAAAAVAAAVVVVVVVVVVLAMAAVVVLAVAPACAVAPSAMATTPTVLAAPMAAAAVIRRSRRCARCRFCGVFFVMSSPFRCSCAVIRVGVVAASLMGASWGLAERLNAVLARLSTLSADQPWRAVVSEPAISVSGLVKAFGKVRALKGVDFQAAPGTVLGLLGPNGAGKTTAVRVMTTLLRPDAGSVRVAGLDVVRDAVKLRQRIGLAGQYAAVDENLTGMENLVMVGRLYGEVRAAARQRGQELLERFDLLDAAKRALKTYSGGMRRRLDLAAALVARPPVLFLDEPTTGLDPRSRVALWETIEELVADGTTVLLTTQHLDEADRLADSIVVIDHGLVIAEGTPDLSSRTVLPENTSRFVWSMPRRRPQRLRHFFPCPTSRPSSPTTSSASPSGGEPVRSWMRSGDSMTAASQSMTSRCAAPPSMTCSCR